MAVALARLDRPAWFSTCFADDDYGRLVAAQLDRAGVRLASDPAVDRADVVGGGDHRERRGAATYEFDLDWRLSPLALPAGLAPVVVHTSSLGAVLAPGADDVVAILERLRATATVSYDVNARPVVTGTGPEIIERVERVAWLADVVKASDEDLEALWPDLTHEESARHLLSLGPAVVVVTRGPEGALWVSRSGQGVVGAVRVDVADTIGAGDTFGAALIDGLWERDLLGGEHRGVLAELDAGTWSAVLAWAASVAAVTVSRPGADPPYRHERHLTVDQPGVAADEAEQARLDVGVVRDGDPGAVLARIAHHPLHRLHAREQVGADLRVEGVLLPGGPGEVPGVQEDVGAVEAVDRLRQRVLADVGVGEGLLRGPRVVEDGLDPVGVDLPGADGIVDDRGPGGEPDVGAGRQEPREPADQVVDHVAGGPTVHGRRSLPVAGAADPVGEEPGPAAVPRGRIRRRHRRSSCRARRSPR